MRKKIRGVLNPLYKKYKKQKKLAKPEFENGRFTKTSPNTKCHMSFKLKMSPKYQELVHSHLKK